MKIRTDFDTCTLRPVRLSDGQAALQFGDEPGLIVRTDLPTGTARYDLVEATSLGSVSWDFAEETEEHRQIARAYARRTGGELV